MQVEGVGDQPSTGMGGEAHPGGEHRGGELGDQRGALATEADGAFAPRQPCLLWVDGALAVLAGELRDQPEQLHPGLQLTLAQHVDLVEQPTLAQASEVCRSACWSWVNPSSRV